MSTNHVPDNVIDQLRDNLRAAGIQAAEPDIQGIVAKGFLSRLLDFERAVARVPIDTVPDYLAAWGAADQSGLPNQSSAEAWLPDSQILANNVTAGDAAAAARLEAAGAVIVGKTRLSEFAYSPGSNNAHYGPTRNPRNLERDAGGSSSGSAVAVAD